MVSYHCIIVTAPTCGSAGILPAVLYYLWKDYNVSKNDIYDALAVADIIGNIVKQNASISGAEVFCYWVCRPQFYYTKRSFYFQELYV